MKPIALLAGLLAVSSPIALPATAQSSPHGLPGQASIGITPVQYVSQRYKAGDRLRDDETYLIMDDWWEYGLPDPKDDELYILVGSEIFRVDSETFKVLEAWPAVRSISN